MSFFMPVAVSDYNDDKHISKPIFRHPRTWDLQFYGKHFIVYGWRILNNFVSSLYLSFISLMSQTITKIITPASRKWKIICGQIFILLLFSLTQHSVQISLCTLLQNCFHPRIID